MSYPNFWVLKLEWVMIYFIFLQVWHRSLVISSFIGETWRGFGFASNLLTCPLVDSSTYHVTLSLIQATCKLVHSLTCPLTMLLCLLFSLSTSNLLTRPLVDLSTYHVTLSFYYPVYKQLVNSALIKSSTQHKKWRKNSNRLFFQYFFTTFVP